MMKLLLEKQIRNNVSVFLEREIIDFQKTYQC